MASGTSFDKGKVLSAAEKFVAQGKFPQAIEKYQELLARDQKDLNLLNTVADLCVRAGRTEEAVKRFYELTDHCVEAGLVPRAIATLKRITKISPDSVEALVRQGDLYSMQGLLRDSRENYQQAVEHFSNRGDKDKARDVFEKLLMLDMENPRLQIRMAELYAQTGKRGEAIATYLGAINQYLERNEPGEAITTIERLLVLDPQNPEARALLGRAQLDQGAYDQAALTLQGIPAVETRVDALGLLFRTYRKQGDAAKAREIANKLFETHEDFSALAQIAESYQTEGASDEALEIYRSASEKLLAERPPKVLIAGLRKILDSKPSHTGALELLVKAYHTAGSVGDVRETSELLAQAYRAQGDLEKAREVYQELVSVEPDNSDHGQLLRQVEAEMGIGAEHPDASPEPAAAMVSDLSAPETAPKAESLSQHEKQVVKDCITEAELYITYRQTPKAIAAVERGLVELPGNITLMEQLFTLYEKSRQFAKAADCAEALTEAYVKLGDGERASRYGESGLIYRQKAEEAGAAEPDLAESAPPEVAVVQDADARSSFAEPPPEAAEPQVREVDLSMEWASVTSTAPASEAGASEDSLVEEIEFYLQAGLNSDALAALGRLEASSPSHPAVAGFRERLGLGQKADAPAEGEAASPAPTVPFELITGEPASDITATPSMDIGALGFGAEPEPAAAEFPMSVDALQAEPSPVLDFLVPPNVGVAPIEGVPGTPVAEPAAGTPGSDRTFEPVVESFGSVIEGSQPAPPQEVAAGIDDLGMMLQPEIPQAGPASAPEFELSLEEAPAMSTAQPPAPIPAPPADPFATLTGDLAGELEGSFPASGPSKQPEQRVPPPPAPTAGAQPAGAFDDIFADFKAEMEEPAAADDMETHYNMGVAFKEMALYDEAIGEFQKAHQVAVKSKDYSNVVQCCSLLATCFLEKGMPLLAVKWYQTAIDAPGVDAESSLALLYELGSAHETAGDRQAALGSFLEVYARNIDYRDVADRIRSLKQQ